MAFTLPALGYAYDALEPHIDARTMEIHHTKHHQAYITNLNNAIAGSPLEGKTLDEIIKGMDMTNMPVRNNGGGHWNHTMFWELLRPEDKGRLSQRCHRLCFWQQGNLHGKVFSRSHDKIRVRMGLAMCASGWQG